MPSYGYTYPDRFFSLEKLSTATPDYWSKVAQGLQLPENYHKLHRKEGNTPLYERSDGSLVNETGARGFYWPTEFATSGVLQTGTGVTYPGVRCTPTAVLENEIAYRLNEKARNTTFNMGVFLGEFPETLGFITGAVRAIAGSIRDVQKGKFRQSLERLSSARTVSNTERVADVATSSWLGWSYGVRPLLSDVQDAAVQAAKWMLREPRPLVVRTHQEDSGYGRGISPSGVRWENRCRFTRSVQAKMYFEVDRPLQDVGRILGLTNPVSILYNLTPYSFVLDWFVPVGRWIESVYPPQGLRLKGGHTYTKVRGAAWQSTDINPPFAEWHTSAAYWETFKERKPLTNLPSPKLIIPDLSLGKAQYASAYSLLYQAVASVVGSRR